MFVIIFLGIWALVGIIFLIIGKKEINFTSKNYGKVTDMVRHQSYNRDGGYSASWHPVIEYNVGELFIKEFAYGSSQSKYAIGQDVEVYYNPEDYIAGDTMPKTLAAIFTIVGIGAITIAIFYAILIL